MDTAFGRQFTSAAMSVMFLTLAAGSYVVQHLPGVAHKSGRKDLLYWGAERRGLVQYSVAKLTKPARWDSELPR